MSGTYNAKVHRRQGGEDLVVASGGEIIVESGGKITVESGGELELASGATFDRGNGSVYRGRAALAAVDTAGGVFAIANPAGARVILTGLWVDVTTFTSGACTLDAGIAADGTTLNDAMIDGASLATAAGVRNHIKHAGTNGSGALGWGASEFLTGSVASGASAGLVGFVYYEYMTV